MVIISISGKLVTVIGVYALNKNETNQMKGINNEKLHQLDKMLMK